MVKTADDKHDLFNQYTTINQVGAYIAVFFSSCQPEDLKVKSNQILFAFQQKPYNRAHVCVGFSNKLLVSSAGDCDLDRGHGRICAGYMAGLTSIF